MAEALATYASNFERITKESADYPSAIVAVLRHEYDLNEQEVLRNRLLIAEQALVGVHRQSPREEEARQLAQARTRELEFAWATFLARAMEQGVVPEADPRLLTRAVLGLHNSVWHWYRPDGTPNHTKARGEARRIIVVARRPQAGGSSNSTTSSGPA